MTGAAETGHRPVRIGVTGHRLLAELDKVGAGIDAAIRRIETAFPGRPLVVVSPLAEGADRLVVSRVFDRHPEARLLVLLPMSDEEYLKDFVSEESKVEFERLRRRATCCIELQAGETREDSYEAVGIAVLDHADVLLAIWDGKKGRGKGGTAGIVRRARERGVPIAWVHAGNRRPGTNVPTSLGMQQGRVTFERFEVEAQNSTGVKRDAPDSDLMPALPYRIRVGVVAEGYVDRESLELLFPASILSLFDPKSRKQLAKARHTPIGYSVLTRTDTEPERQIADAIRQILAAEMRVVVQGDLAKYLDHFNSKADREQTEELLRLARLPILLEAGARVERFIVDHCDVLVLIEPADTRPGVVDSIEALAHQKERPILRLRSGPPGRVQVRRGHGLNAKSIARLDTFNRSSPGRQDVQEYVKNVYQDLFAAAEGQDLPPTARQLVHERLLPYYAKASYLAKRSQRSYRRAGTIVWVLFPLAIAAVALSIHVPSWSQAALMLELLFLATIAIVVIGADRRRSLQVWIESRFLTERIRCAAFLAACGFEASSIRVPPYMGDPEQRDEWMILAFNEIWGRLPPLRGCHGSECTPIRRFVQKAWVDDQIEYHRRKADDCERMARRLERWGTAMFLLALVAAVLHLMTSKSAHSAMRFEGALTFAAIVLPAVGAAMGGFRSHREYTRLAKRSRNMWQELRELRERLSEAEDPESIRRTLSETEEMMLGETQDWLMLMRFVPVKYPG